MSPPCAGFLLRQTVKLRSFRHKGLSDFYRSGKAAKIRPDLQGRVLRRLDALDVARDSSDLNVPGFDFHPLRGFKPMRYSLHVNGRGASLLNGWTAMQYAWTLSNTIESQP